MARYEVAMGSGGIASTYTELLKPITDDVIAGIHESRKLAEMRDYLLPKLLSGQVRVSAAE
jgi:type I restriction enzyme S subunit